MVLLFLKKVSPGLPFIWSSFPFLNLYIHYRQKLLSFCQITELFSLIMTITVTRFTQSSSSTFGRDPLTKKLRDRQKKRRQIEGQEVVRDLIKYSYLCSSSSINRLDPLNIIIGISSLLRRKSKKRKSSDEIP